MSYQLPPNAAPLEDNDDYSSSSGSDTTECDNFSNWAEDPEDASALAVPLFGQPGEQVQNVQQAMEIDRSKGFDLEREVERLGLDFHQRVRLINHIRKTTPSVETVAKLIGTEELFQDDSLLIPVLENDAYLQVGDSWDSDSDEDLDAPSQPQSSSGPSSQTPKESDAELQKARRKIRSLEDKIKALQAEAQYELGSLKNILKDRMNVSNGVESREVEVKDGAEAEGKKVNEEGKGKGKERDDDSHYFDSYAYNDIHEIMLKDTTRTKSYAIFILSNPHLFKDAVVLDVGCGTGILSLFAAKAGAKHVYAVDASDVAKKAIENIKNNGYADKITVVRGKVEDIQLPVDHVDIIISEWMGYFLLYESMLDSVLVARDRFLRKGGVLAPSQTKIMLAGVDCADFMKQRVGFWEDVYGFDMRTMAQEMNEDSLVEIMEESELVTSCSCIKDIVISSATIKSLDFTSPFSITASRDSTMHAFLGYFDTFFTPDGSAVDENVEVDLFRHDEELKVEAKDGEKNIVSFTTGPQGVPTHWKQTLFVLKEPIQLRKGATITGTFLCQKSYDINNRELDVEIHYKITEPDGSARDASGRTNVQLFKVR